MNINSFDEFGKKYLDEIINSYLITKDVRKAFLLQPIDYGESTKNSTTTKSILKRIKKLFPTLKYTPMRQGILISKEHISAEEYDNDKGLAEILSFPCVIQSDKKFKYKYSIIFEIFNKKYYLISYGCYEKMYEKSETLLNKIKEALSELGITNVYLEEVRHVSEEELLYSLENNKPLKKEEMDELLNYFFNLSFPSEFNETFKQIYQDNNPVHRGMIITLVNYFNNDVLDPFYPLDPDSEVYKNLLEMSKKFSNSILKSLESTKTRTNPKRNSKTRKLNS